MTRNSNSNFGRGGTYICGACDKRTRATGTYAATVELCDRCFDGATYENHHLDYHDTPAHGCVLCFPAPCEENATTPVAKE